MQRQHLLIGVIGAEIHSTEQRRIISGILTAAQEENIRTAVFSNIFNPLEPELADCAENRIYRHLFAPDLDALIMLSESFVNEKLRDNICQMLKQRTDIPVILIGAAIPGFDFPRISTSDADDIAEITSHLIEAHGFRDIAMLTGPLSQEVSRIRIAGYRRALETHGIPFDESNVFEGDFWYHSGEALAKQFISGERKTPEALVCANDYMAFGVLDAYENAGIRILDHMAVAGYEFISERNLHTPLLTTYRRSRQALGETAVQILLRRLRGEPEQPFEPPHGRLIPGLSCSCDISQIQQHEELVEARLNKQYADWYLRSELERLLTECTNMDAFTEAMGKYLFVLRWCVDLFLCLYEDWHRPEIRSEVLLCRSVNPWADRSVFRLKQNDLRGIIERNGDPAAYYWLPLCFRDRLFGYCVLRYDQPDCYDDICRSWMKAVANCLEFMRLKADVRYLLQCRALSVSYDSMTGMFSADGLKSAYQLMQNANGARSVTAVLLRCCAETDSFSTSADAAFAVDELMNAAHTLERYQGGCICGRVSEYAFLLLLPQCSVPPAVIEYAAAAELLRKSEPDAFLCTAAEFPCGTNLSQVLQSLNDTAEALASQRTERMLRPHYPALRGIRSTIYKKPTAAHSIEQCAAAIGFNTDYLNRKYKECFGLSFHQDCIRSKLLYAAYLLLNTALNITETAEQCGYSESKYFIRQFAAVIGCPPKAFRDSISQYRTE